MQPRRALIECLARQRLGPDAAVAVACSGGGDSVALADLVAARVAERALAGAALIHVDHGLRPGSAAEADVVAALAARLGLGFHGVRATVERRASLEDAARRARYAALAAAADALAVDAVLLAHTADDQAETVLLRLLRGTGPGGLAAMRERRGRYVRPLLPVRRAALVAHRLARDLPAFDDPMNHDPAFARVRIRALVPVLERENPALIEALGRLARHAGEDHDALSAAAGRLRAAASGDGGLTTEALAAAPPALAKRALVAEAHAAGLEPLSAAAQDAVIALCADPPYGTVELDLHGGVARRTYHRIGFTAHGTAAPAPPALAISGAGGPYAIRPWRAGDRMAPVRLRGRSKKLSDLYSELRIPRPSRAAARVVVDAAGVIVWAEHVGPAHGSAVEVTLTEPGTVARKQD